MAGFDFGFLSDSDNSAVDEIITQAAELSVLEQVAKINCSGFTDSVLPTELESRFRKLKSFPVSASKPIKKFDHSKSELTQLTVKNENKATIESDEESNEVFSPSKRDPDGKSRSLKGKPKWENDSEEESEIFSASKQNPNAKSSSKNKSKHGSDSSYHSDMKSFSLERKSRSSKGNPNWENDSDEENEIFSAAKQNPDGKFSSKTKSKHGSAKESKSKSGFVNSPLDLLNSWLDSPSPPRKSGCFLCSPINFSKKKSKGEDTEFDFDKTDELLSDLNIFSLKKQQKKFKKAMKQQEKMNKEAEKIVKWAKQASARMSVHGIEDEFSDDNESTK